MIPQDYASQESFFNKLDAYLADRTARQQWLNEKTIVLFPEYIGTWLVFANASEKIFRASTLNAAERAMVFRHPLKLSAYFLKSTEKGKVEAAFFRIKASQMAAIYQTVFSQLAQDYAITVIAGSTVLPAPQILNGELIPERGASAQRKRCLRTRRRAISAPDMQGISDLCRIEFHYP